MYEIKLGLQAIIRNHKRTFTTIGIMMLLIAFVVLINAAIYTNRATRDLGRELHFGSWSHAFSDASQSGAFESVGALYTITHSLGSFDKPMFELSNLEYYKGREPRNEKEAIVTLDAINTLGISYDLGQSVSIDDYQFDIVGIVYSYNVDWNWIVGLDYPWIITTNMLSNKVVYFGRASKLNQFYNADDYVAVNTNAYPYIEIGTELLSQRNEETMRMNEQSLKLTQFMLIVMVMVFAVVFKNNAAFYKKRLEILSQQGFTKWGLFKYILPQLMIYTLMIPLGFYMIHVLFKYGSIPIKSIRYANNMEHLNYASVRTCLIVAVFLLFSFILEAFKLHQTYRLRFVHIILVMVVSFVTVYIATPQIITIYDQRLPLLRMYREVWEASMYYVANGSMGTISEEKTELSHFNTEWEKADFTEVIKHPKTEYVYYWNLRYPQAVDKDVQYAGINYFNDELLKTLALVDSLSEDFHQGNSFYIFGDGEYDLEIGDLVYFNGLPFYYEQQFGDDVAQVKGIPLFTGLLISEAGAQRLGFPTNKYNMFQVGVEKMSDYLEYDVLMRRVAKQSMFSNLRLTNERGFKRETGITIFMALEILIQYGLGLALLALLFLQSLMVKRRTIAIYHFLGESKTKMIFKNSTSFVLPAASVMLPAILVVGKQAIQSKSLIFSFIIGIIFIIVLLIVCLLIHMNFFRNDLFELLDERE